LFRGLRAYLFDLPGYDNNIQMQTDYGSHISIDRKSIDHAIRNIGLGQDIQQDLDNVILAIGDGLHEFLCRHGVLSPAAAASCRAASGQRRSTTPAALYHQRSRAGQLM
jgi:hypothetical protein